MLVIARSTEKELARQVSYLKAENQILRSRLPDRISLTQREKNRLVRFAKKLGSALNELATIVHPGTIRRWIRKASDKKRKKSGKNGRPRTAEPSNSIALLLILAEITLRADREFLLSMNALQCINDEQMKIGSTSSNQKLTNSDNKNVEAQFLHRALPIFVKWTKERNLTAPTQQMMMSISEESPFATEIRCSRQP